MSTVQVFLAASTVVVFDYQKASALSLDSPRLHHSPALTVSFRCVTLLLWPCMKSTKDEAMEPIQEADGSL